MKTADIIIAHPGNSDKSDALKAFMKALKIKFEVRTDEQSSYNKEFTAAVLQGDKDLRNGKGKKITTETLDNLWK